MEGSKANIGRKSGRLGLLVAGLGAMALGIVAAGCTQEQKTEAQKHLCAWLADTGNATVVEHGPSTSLTGVIDPKPVLINESVNFFAPTGVNFNPDKSGLWVIDRGTGPVKGGGFVPAALNFFKKSTLANLPTISNPPADVRILSDFFVFPQQGVFDTPGNFWVSDSGANQVFVFSPTQLATGGTAVTPIIRLSSDPPFNVPLGIAFSSGGNLWLANNGGNTLFEFNASALAGLSGPVTLTPDVMLSDNGHGSINRPWALAFKKDGTLFSSNMGNNTIVGFASSSLGTTGSPDPAVTITSTTLGGNDTLVQPNGIAFNPVWTLGVVNWTANSLAVFTRKQISASGETAPRTRITGANTTLNGPTGLTFGPFIGHKVTF